VQDEHAATVTNGQPAREASEDHSVRGTVTVGAAALDQALIQRLYTAAKAERWALRPATFRDALEESARRAFAGQAATTKRELERYLNSLHLADLALACACADGSESAWDHVVREYRPILYRSADALDATGASRELADSLYAELYGLREQEGERRSLFRYFHGRSSLATWLRSVLAQRYVDWVRSRRRLDPLPDDDITPSVSAAIDPDTSRYQALLQQALAAAISQLAPRDRLRLGCYYAEQLTLAEIGRLTHEHEATVSRQLARTRRALREHVERTLRHDRGLTDAEIVRCFEVVVEDAGPLNLDDVLAGAERSQDSRAGSFSVKTSDERPRSR